MVYLKTLLESVITKGYKSNVINSLVLIFFVFIFAIGVASYFKIYFLEIGLGILILICAFSLLFAYFYCLFNNPDLLRSERYNLEQKAISKISVSGDSAVGAVINLPNTEFVKYQGTNNLLGNVEDEKKI